MSTPAQINANIQNAQSSTGPRTEAGKTACSKNAVTHALFTSADFIRPGEESIYAAFREDFLHELAPEGLLEHTLVDEIRRATWRLRRCGQVEADLVVILSGANPHCIFDPMETDNLHADKVQKSVDRARAQAHRLLHRCTAELRKLQTERRAAAAKPAAPAISRDYNSDPIAIHSSIPIRPNIARNALCPCKSGEKYKRCCGKSAPPMVQAA